MCSFSRPPSPPPAPEIIPSAPPSIAIVFNAFSISTSASASATNTAMKKRRGRGSLRIPLTSSGLSQSGVNFPTS